MKCFLLSYLKNVLYREPSFIVKYYLHKGKSLTDSPEYVFMANGKMLHGGLFDRLKGIISIYAIAKVQKKDFSIYFKEPFDLEKYLVPASYDWTTDNVMYNYPESRPVIAYSEFKNPRRLFKNRKGQTHFYFGNDIIDEINGRYGTSFKWECLFRELFIPSEYLGNYLKILKSELESDYMAIHIRFLNLLGDKVEVNKCIILGESDKNALIGFCLKKIDEIIIANPQWRPIISSDSMIFLKEVKMQFPEVYIVPGEVKHIDAMKVFSEDENLKLFSDVYLMADAKKVYSIVGKGLYKSAFPEYSAKIGDRPFERIQL